MLEHIQYQFNLAEVGDAASIASLFRKTYGRSSHECADETYVARSLTNPDYLWVVGRLAGSIVSVMCAARHSWNRTYEIGYTITDQGHRGNGIVRGLYTDMIARLEQLDDCDFIVAHVRNVVTHDISTKLGEPVAVAVGHDGAINLANDRREFHVITLKRNPYAGVTRVVPTSLLASGLVAAAARFSRHLNLETVVGGYPSTLLTGKPGGKQIGLGECVIGYDYDPDSPSGAFQIASVTAETEDAARFGLFALLERLEAYTYVSLVLLADKTHLLGELQGRGFSVTAYLPAWHCDAGQRFDCLMLVRSHFAEAPATNGLGDLISQFNSNYERRTDNHGNATLVEQGPVEQAERGILAP